MIYHAVEARILPILNNKHGTQISNERHGLTIELLIFVILLSTNLNIF
jgi:hypothetical protein